MFDCYWKSFKKWRLILLLGLFSEKDDKAVCRLDLNFNN